MFGASRVQNYFLSYTVLESRSIIVEENGAGVFLSEISVRSSRLPLKCFLNNFCSQ